MKNIRIAKNVKSEIDDFRIDGENVDSALNRLFEIVEDNRFDVDDGATSVKISDENVSKLKSHKAYATESYSSVILRLLESIK